MYRKNIVHSCSTRIDVDSSLLRAWSIHPIKKSHDYLFEIIDRQTFHNLKLNLAAKNVLLLKSPRQYFLSPLTAITIQFTCGYFSVGEIAALIVGNVNLIELALWR